MFMQTQRTHVVIPQDLVVSIDRVVGKRERSGFLVQAARNELKRLHLLDALKQARGVWKASNHPELKTGTDSWVSKLRRQSDTRLM